MSDGLPESSATKRRSIDRDVWCVESMAGAPTPVVPAGAGGDLARVVAGDSLRVIASRLGRAVWTISREVAGNGGRLRYRAAWQRARWQQRCSVAVNAALRGVVEDKPALRWSPQQVSGWLRYASPREGDLLKRNRPPPRPWWNAGLAK